MINVVLISTRVSTPPTMPLLTLTLALDILFGMCTTITPLAGAIQTLRGAALVWIFLGPFRGAGQFLFAVCGTIGSAFFSMLVIIGCTFIQDSFTMFDIVRRFAGFASGSQSISRSCVFVKLVWAFVFTTFAATLCGLEMFCGRIGHSFGLRARGPAGGDTSWLANSIR